MSRRRYFLLDSLRGFALMSMIIYHALWDLVYIFGVDIAWFKPTSTYFWQQSICWTFILISGFCQPLGRKNLSRGIIVVLCSLIITAVTYITMPGGVILFGVLSLIGSGMILSHLLDKPLKQINCYVGFISFFGIFLFLKYFGMDIFPTKWNTNLFTAFLGFPPADFSSADYFPLIPWIFLYFTGYFLCLIFKKKNLMQFLCSPRIKPMEFFGRHSLEIYMFHQPVIYAILYFLYI